MRCCRRIDERSECTIMTIASRWWPDSSLLLNYNNYSIAENVYLPVDALTKMAIIRCCQVLLNENIALKDWRVVMHFDWMHHRLQNWSILLQITISTIIIMRWLMTRDRRQLIWSCRSHENRCHIWKSVLVDKIEQLQIYLPCSGDFSGASHRLRVRRANRSDGVDESALCVRKFDIDLLVVDNMSWFERLLSIDCRPTFVLELLSISSSETKQILYDRYQLIDKPLSVTFHAALLLLLVFIITPLLLRRITSVGNRFTSNWLQNIIYLLINNSIT
jgi:hypothetical protein